MNVCSQCGAQFHESGNFCSVCGTPTTPMYPQQQPYRQPLPYLQPPYSREPPYSQPPPLPVSSSYPSLLSNPHHAAARGFAQIFGIHPAVAFLTFIVDSMLFGGEFVTGGAILPLSIAASVVLGFIAYRAQMKWYGDDKESALIKALILAFLTAIPTNIPAFVYVPAGIVGFFRRKKD